jgi:hypothetical protein
MTPIALKAFLPNSPRAIQHAVRVESAAHTGQDIIGQLNSALSWTHYRTLIKVDRQEAIPQQLKQEIQREKELIESLREKQS